MNIAKRQKNNGLESIVTIAPLSMINGLFLPYPTCALMFTHTFGRYLYNMGYVEKEGAMNKMRMGGALMCHSSHIFTVIISLFLGI